MKFEMTTLLVGRSSGGGPLDAEVEVGADSGKAGRQFLGLGLRVRDRWPLGAQLLQLSGLWDAPSQSLPKRKPT